MVAVSLSEWSSCSVNESRGIDFNETKATNEPMKGGLL